MRATDVIQTALDSAHRFLEWYLSDLSDADLLVRPVPEANHIAWQVGHLINSEQGMIKSEFPDAPFPALPAGFAEQHAKETASSDTGFLTKAEYLEWSKKTRAVTKTILESLSDADLDRPCTGRLAKFTPKVVNLFMLAANHPMMHVGQFTVVRRKLGKPVLI
jgi:hypothetical protein